MGKNMLKAAKEEGVSINLISRESLEALDSAGRVDFVLREVKEGKVLVLERGLSAIEEATLIQKTMKEIDHETFIGIEIQSHTRDETESWLDRLLKRKKTPRMAVIGPANLLRTIHKDGNVIETMLVTHENVIEVPESPGEKNLSDSGEETGDTTEEFAGETGLDISITGMGEEFGIKAGGN